MFIAPVARMVLISPCIPGLWYVVICPMGNLELVEAAPLGSFTVPPFCHNAKSASVRLDVALHGTSQSLSTAV